MSLLAAIKRWLLEASSEVILLKAHQDGQDRPLIMDCTCTWRLPKDGVGRRYQTAIGATRDCREGETEPSRDKSMIRAIIRTWSRSNPDPAAMRVESS